MSELVYQQEEDISNENNNVVFDTGKCDNDMMNDSLLEQDPMTTFSAEFHDGYSFKYLLEMLKEQGDIQNGGNFVFSRDGITYRQANSDNSILNVADIFSDELCEYSYESSRDMYIVGCGYTDICPITKNIGKKDRLRIYKVPGQEEIYLHIIQQTSESNDETNIRTFRPKTIDYTIYSIDDLGDFGEKPIKLVSTNRFKKMTDSMYSVRSKQVTVQCTDNAVIFSASANGGISNAVVKWGDVDRANKYRDINSLYTGQINTNNLIKPAGASAFLEIVPDGFKYEIIMDSSTIRSLAKLNNLCPQGTVKIYMNQQALKLESYIGVYGKITTYIRSNESY